MLIYNPEMIVKIDQQSEESRLNELLMSGQFAEAVRTLRKEAKSTLILKAQNGHLYHVAKNEPNELSKLL